MNATGMLVRAESSDERTPAQKDLWTSTAEKLEKFLPGFLDELIPPPPPPSTESSSADAKSPT